MQLQTADIGSEVARRVAANEPCWFPGLAEVLVVGFWSEMSGLDPASYSTAAWLGSAGCSMVTVPGQSQMAVEPVPLRFASRFEAAAFAEEVPEAASAIACALKRLVPGRAADAVTTLVRSVHIIRARGPGYDFSHSEPTVPFSVFVSVPLGERHAMLRLAESLLHEAMHLQLTLIEYHNPVVGAGDAYGYSPWQQRQRPVQGLFHGLYVFSAIQEWLLHLEADPRLPSDDRTYVERRLCEIGEEIKEVSTLAASSTLTDFGRTLARSLLDPSRLSR
ncbi:HEXXH motif-containing putative peptide modification protein [Mesorhizobium sp. M0578]|uniref:aKG-HExxH-type peptide beta-hydroxylase n=1 Tax=unclassified Mesorhizobium TaxID=325217 RepID=UPI003337A6E8